MWVSTPGEYNAFFVSENITLSVDRYMDGQSVSCETRPAEDWHKTVLDTVVLDIDCKSKRACRNVTLSRLIMQYNAIFTAVKIIMFR